MSRYNLANEQLLITLSWLRESNKQVSSFIHYLRKQKSVLLAINIISSYKSRINYSLVQSLSRVQLFATPQTAACQASLSVANSQSLLKLMSIKSVMPSNHLILCRPLLLLPSVFPSIKVFSNESALHIRWPKYWEFQLHHQSFQ